MPKVLEKPIEIWDASGMTIKVIKRRIKTPEGSMRPILEQIRRIDTASSIIKSRILSPEYLLMINACSYIYEYLRDIIEESLAAFITIFIIISLLMTAFIPSQSFTDEERITLKEIAKQVNLNIGEYAFEDENAYSLLTLFERKKAELQHELKPEQDRRATFALGLFDKSEKNKSTLRTFQENKLFDESLAAEILSFT